MFDLCVFRIILTYQRVRPSRTESDRVDSLSRNLFD